MPERRKTRTRTADKRARDDSRARADRRAADVDEDERYDDEEFDDEQPVAERRGPAKRRTPSLSAADAAQAGVQQIAELTGKDTAGVVFVEPADNGWLVGVELVEDRRVPSTSDLMGLYEVAIDMDGGLVSYRRTRRYSRGRGNGNDNGNGAS